MGKIIGIGRNYVRHAQEQGGAVPTAPIFFLKPSTSIVHEGGTVIIPEAVQRVDHEVELGVVIGKSGRDIKPEKWKDYVLGYCIVLDMTARDLQDAAKKNGEPWSMAKGFDTFCPVSRVVERTQVQDPQDLELQLRVNGELRQTGHTKDMVFTVPQIVSYLSSIMTLERGDLIATGTPEGVAGVKRGDKLEARLAGLITLTVNIDEKQKRRL